MAIEAKADLPGKFRIRKAADQIYSIRERYHAHGVTPVILVGYGAERDWKSGVGNIFAEYLTGLLPIPVPQDDSVTDQGYRPLQELEKLRVKDASFGIIFESSSRGYMPMNNVLLPTSPSQSGALISTLISTDIPHLTTSATYDDLGVIAVPIEPSYKAKGRDYIGPKKFLLLNLVEPEVAVQMLRDGASAQQIEERIRSGEAVPTRLRNFEEFLRSTGSLESRLPLEKLLLENLDRVHELENVSQPTDLVTAVLETMKYSGI